MIESTSTLEDAEILRLLSGDEPPTGEMMNDLSLRIKEAVRSCCIDVHNFMAIARGNGQNTPAPVCDARSPGEFAIGHIPGALNLPLFSDNERAIVGTMYSEKGRSSATVAGMAFVQPKLDFLVSTAADIVSRASSATEDGDGDGNGDGDGDNDSDINNSIIDDIEQFPVLLLHCWRGGMRSCALAFLIQIRIPGLRVYVLEGGYKSFRKWQYSIYCYLSQNANYDTSYDENHDKRKKKNFSKKKRLKFETKKAAASGIGIAKREAAIAKVRATQQLENATDMAAAKSQWKAEVKASALAEKEWDLMFAHGPRIIILGGPTGSGKTKVLHALRDILGEQIIDLEGLANHSGSAFGFVGHEPQPTPQQYTNDVAMQWASLDPERLVFIEDEGPNVGRVNLPVGLYRKMRTASVVLKLDIPRDIRVQVLREDYALPEKENDDDDDDTNQHDLSEWLIQMIEATRSLEKRIGFVRKNTMINLLRDGDYGEFASLALEYYDDLYHKHITNEHGSANMNKAGKRAATISTVTVDNMKHFHAETVARQVLITMQTIINGTNNTREIHPR